jgi:hypothetical protein
MPRPIDIASLGNLGPGSLPKGAVEDVSLSNPNRDTLPLAAHVKDPSRAHMASSTGIEDAGGYYASDEVEGALQEIGGAHSEGRQNGVVTGFGYTAASLVVTFNTPSTALLPTLRTYSGESVTLPDNTLSVWAYINATTGNITLLAAALPPTISGPENILLWQFTTSGGAITGARDARLYVRNLDRKLPFTVRASGPQADQESEACFVTLDAALTYLQYSTPLAGLRTEVIIRGPVTTGPIDLPIDGIQFRGEDGATVTLTSGAYLFDLKGHAGVSFSDLVLATNVAGATAIVDSVGATERFSLTRCVFTDGTFPWATGVDLTTGLANFTISGCSFRVTGTGISVATPDAVLVDNTVVDAVNFGATGIRIGVSPLGVGARASIVRGCTVTKFDIGVEVLGVGHVVSQCKVTPGATGTVGIFVRSSQDVVVTGCRVDCDQNAGLVGLRADASTADITGLKVVNNTFFGARVYGIDFQGSVQESVVSGNTIDCNIPTSPNDPTALAGIYVHLAGVPTRVPSYLTVSGNVVWRACTGIVFEGGVTDPILEVAVTGNVVHHCAVGVAGSPTTLFETSTGIGAVYCAGLNLSANEVYGIGAILTDAGAVVLPTPADVYSDGIFFRDCTRSAVSGNQIREFSSKGGGKSAGFHYDGPGTGAAHVSRGVKVSGNGIDNIPGDGILFVVGSAAAAFARTFEEPSISDNTIGQVESGIRFVAGGLGVVNNLLIGTNLVNDVDTNNGVTVNVVEAPGIASGGSLQGLSVAGNLIANTAAKGVAFSCENNCTAVGILLDRNMVRLPQSHGIEISVGVSLGAGPTLFEDVSVSGNEIIMTGSVATDAISWNSVASSIDNVRIDDNFITDAVDGVDLGAVGSGSPAINTTLSNFTFRGNKIVASGRGFIGNVSGHVNLFEASGNDVVASGGVFALAPIATAPAVTSSSDLTFRSNRFRAATGANTRLQFADMKVNGVRFEGNLLRGGDAASVGGLQVIISGSDTGLLPSVRNLHVSNNTFRNMDCAGVALSVAGPTDPIVDTVLSNNTFEAVATDVATTRASVVRFDAGAVVRNLKVCGNQVLASGHSTATHGGFDFTLAGGSGLDFSDNQFNVSSGAASNTYGNFLYMEASASPSDLKDVKVCRNQVRGVEVPNTSTSLSLISLDLRGFATVENLSVCDNDLDRVDNGAGNTNGVRLQTTNALARFSCDRNRVTGVGSDSAAFFLLVGASGASEVSVSGNHVTGDTTTGASGPGIRLNFGGTGSDIRVCDNTLIGDPAVPADDGILIDGGVALELLRVESNSLINYQDPVTISCNDLSDLSFSDNSVASFTVSNYFTFMAAYRLVVTGNSRRLSITNNRCNSTATQSRGWAIELGDDLTGVSDSCRVLVFSQNMVRLSGAVPTQALYLVTAGSEFKNFVFSGNVFRGSTAGIGYLASGAPPTPPPDQCTFMGNIGDNSSGNSWSQFATSWTNVLPNPIATFQAFNIDDGT